MREEVSISELVLPSGRVMLFESPDSGLAPSDVGLTGRVQLKDLLADLKEFSTLLLEMVRAVSPAEAEIELSVGVEADTGRLMALIAGAKASGGLKLRLTWKKER